MKIALFMTYGGSLGVWRRAGILARELSLYKDHADAGLEIGVVSYGGPEETAIRSEFPFVTVLCNTHNLHMRVYAALIPLIHRHWLSQSYVFKTNQLYGAHVARRAATLFRKPLIVRQGFGYYENTASKYGAEGRAARNALRYEKRYLDKADYCVMSTERLLELACTRYGLDRKKMQVIPNFVDIDRWMPGPENTLKSGPAKIAFVGRLVEPKNPLLLVEACVGLDVEITMVGDGPLRSSVERYAREKEVNVTFVGQLPHGQIRDAIQNCFAFVLPSLYEGHPKTLIEAMAMAMPVIGTRVRGIAEIIVDRQTGLLCEGDAVSLRAAIMELENDRALGARLGLAARQYVMENFGLDRVACKERALYEKLAAKAC